MPYYERHTRSGRLLEVERYYATRDGRRISRGPNTEESSADQAYRNDVQAANRLRRILLANFSPEAGDLFVTLTLRGMTEEAEADAAWRRFMGRVKRERAARTLPEAKWIKVKEKQSGRWHYHVVMNAGLTVEELHTLWGRSNRLTASVLDDSDNYRGLSRYLVKGEKPRKGTEESESSKEAREKYKRRWSCSRNLAKPVVVKKREISPRSVLRAPKAPKGYRLLPEWVMGTDRFGSPYLRFECVSEEAAARREKKDPAGSSRERAANKRGAQGVASASD